MLGTELRSSAKGIYVLLTAELSFQPQWLSDLIMLAINQLLFTVHILPHDAFDFNHACPVMQRHKMVSREFY